MGKVNIRFYIQMRVKLGFDATSIYADFISVLGDQAHSYPTVARWVTRFKEGREELEDEKNYIALGTPFIEQPKSSRPCPNMPQVSNQIQKPVLAAW